MPSYPDILNEYIDASTRFEIDGLQYVIEDPPALDPGATTSLKLYLQNTLDVALKVDIIPKLPQIGRLRSRPILKMDTPQYSINLAPVEVGILNIPFTTDAVAPGSHNLELDFKIQHEKEALKVREPRAQDPLASLPIDSPIGLGLVGVVGTSYSLKPGKKSEANIVISDNPASEPKDQDLKESYTKLWDRDIGHLQQEAQKLINDIRASIASDINVEALFIALYAENQQRFADVGLPLRIGEAIALAKLLTYTSHIFLNNPQLQDGLLCPIWERAIYNNYPTTDIRQTIRVVGYKHILKLALTISFGMIAQKAGKQLWSKEERDGVRDYIIDALEDGAPIEEDFLYLPLMMGAALVLKQVRLPNEDIANTIALVKQAQLAREYLFRDSETRQAQQLYAHFLDKL